MEVRGLTGEDCAAFARKNDAELVDFAAPRGPRMNARAWLETVASLDGLRKREGAALADAVLRRAGLAAFAAAPLSSLTPFARAALAVAEVAVGIAGRSNAKVVLPEPPLAWPLRHELRRAAIEILGDVQLWIHARDAGELAPLMARDSIVSAAGISLAPDEGQRSFVLRVYGWGEPYTALRAALEALGIKIGGGPIAHVLSVPSGLGAREILAAAFDAGVDVLEVREAI